MLLDLFVKRDRYGDYTVRDTLGHVYATMTVTSPDDERKLGDLFDLVDKAFAAGFADAREGLPPRRFDLLKRNGALVIVDDRQTAYGSVQAGLLHRLAGRRMMDTAASAYGRGRFVFDNRQTLSTRRDRLSDVA